MVTFGCREVEVVGVRWTALTRGTTGVVGFCGGAFAGVRSEGIVKTPLFLRFNLSVVVFGGLVVIAGTFMASVHPGVL